MCFKISFVLTKCVPTGRNTRPCVLQCCVSVWLCVCVLISNFESADHFLRNLVRTSGHYITVSSIGAKTLCSGSY